MKQLYRFRVANLLLAAFLGLLCWYAYAESRSIPWTIGYGSTALLVAGLGIHKRKE